MQESTPGNNGLPNDQESGSLEHDKNYNTAGAHNENEIRRGSSSKRDKQTDPISVNPSIAQGEPGPMTINQHPDNDEAKYKENRCDSSNSIQLPAYRSSLQEIEELRQAQHSAPATPSNSANTGYDTRSMIINDKILPLPPHFATSNYPSQTDHRAWPTGRRPLPIYSSLPPSTQENTGKGNKFPVKQNNEVENEDYYDGEDEPLSDSQSVELSQEETPSETSRWYSEEYGGYFTGYQPSSSISRLHEPDILRQFPSICSIMVSDPSQLGQNRPRRYEDVAGRMSTDMWKEEGTVCLIVRLRGIAVTRRCDNNMINGTKLLNSARISRGRRDGMLKAERIRHVVRVGGMDYKGVWVPFERALDMAKQENVLDMLYPLFISDLREVFRLPENNSRLMQIVRGARLNTQFSMWLSSMHDKDGKRSKYGHLFPIIPYPHLIRQKFPRETSDVEESLIDPSLQSNEENSDDGQVPRKYPVGAAGQSPPPIGEYDQYLRHAYVSRSTREPRTKHPRLPHNSSEIEEITSSHEESSQRNSKGPDRESNKKKTLESIKIEERDTNE